MSDLPPESSDIEKQSTLTYPKPNEHKQPTLQ